MNWKIFLLIGIILLSTISACRGSGPGPMVWIDQPLENSEFPEGVSIILQAHSSDSDGITSIEFYLDEYSLVEVSSSGRRMGEAFYSWTPPSAGVYTIYAVAIDNEGNRGMPASSSITIGNQFAKVLPSEPQPPVEDALDEEEEEDPIQMELPEEPSENPGIIPIRAINCRDFPDLVSNIIDFLEKDQPAIVVGRLVNNTWYLVTHPIRRINCWVSASLVTTTGDFNQVPVLQVQAPQQPPPPPEQPPSPPTDTTAPTIMSVSISPTTIYQQGCIGDQQTAVLTVEAVDLGGIAFIEAAWTNGSVNLSYVGGYAYQGTIGPINTTGAVTIYGSAVDSAGNWTPFTIIINVQCCIC